MELFTYTKSDAGLSGQEIRAALLKSLEGRTVRKALILPSDFTRFHSNAGFITNVYYHILMDQGAEVDILPALGAHVPVTKEEAAAIFGDIPYEKFIPHDWHSDKEESKGAGFRAADYDEMVKRYDPEKLQYGYNTPPDGEEILHPQSGPWALGQPRGVLRCLLS